MSLVTRCPHCDTSFRVTDEQLAAAAGAVRCGACLGVFSAPEHLVVADGESVAEPEAQDAGGGQTDESVAEEEANSPPETVDDAVSGDNRQTHIDDIASLTDLTGLLIDEELPVDRAEAPQFGQGGDVPMNDRDPGTGTAEEEVPAETRAEEIIGDYKPSVPRHYVAWALASLGMALFLGGQLAWFNRDVWAESPDLRGYYESVCGVLGCSLPVYSDPDSLHVTHLVVRTHPRIAHALAVDAIIRNSAPWRQYFPDLSLRFSDIQGHLVAARIFKPADYLAGEMTGVKFIPAGTEVRITLEIVDPGQNATNYSLTIAR